MTKRKTNPQKRGRRGIPDLARRMILVLWEHFIEENPKLPVEVRFHHFCAQHRSLLRELRISVADYQVLKNMLTRARRARVIRKGRPFEEHYLDEAAKFALGLPSLWRPLFDPN